MNKNAVLEVGLDKLDMEAAARVAQRFLLQEIFLVDAKISRDPLIMSPEALSLEHKCSTDSLSTSDKEKHLFLCNYRVAAFDDKEPSKLVMQIEAIFCTSYVKKSDIRLFDDDYVFDDDSILTYVEYLMTINPISDTWPYWREFVQSMSSRMGFPALTVPLLEIRPKKPEEKPKDEVGKKVSKQRKKVSA
jgi:hypothetical protein